MAEWRIEELDGDNPIVWIDEHTYFVAEHDPSMIVNAHNADCAAYRAELARVKAESLRVVADGEANKAGVLKNNTTFVVSNVLHVNHWHGAYIRMGGGSWRGEVGYDTIVQPVRIERWED